jgi:hypothetical protein
MVYWLILSALSNIILLFLYAYYKINLSHSERNFKLLEMELREIKILLKGKGVLNGLDK